MFKNIVLAGGGAGFKGLDVRLAKELQFLTRGGVGTVSSTEVNVIKPATTTGVHTNATTGTTGVNTASSDTRSGDPTVSTWIGGSLMARSVKSTFSLFLHVLVVVLLSVLKKALSHELHLTDTKPRHFPLDVHYRGHVRRSWAYHRKAISLMIS